MSSNESGRILLVEDDSKLARVVREYLETNGFTVSIEGRGDRAEDRIRRETPDLVILDIMLPGKDGLAVCKGVRPDFKGPILMLTARGDEVDEIVGLEVGADDYLAKPVQPRRLLSRINALLRRTTRRPDPPREVSLPDVAACSRIELGPLVVDAANRRAQIRTRELELTTAEFDLLWLLASHAGEVLTREQIYAALRGIDYDGLDRSVDLRVVRLRRKLGDDGKQPQLIKSVRGMGYLLVRNP